MEEKDKLIEILPKKLKGVPSDHPQTEEIVVIEGEKEKLNKEVLELKAKVLQITKEKEDLVQEKEELISQISNHEPLEISQPVDTIKLTDYMSRVSLKENEISQLVQEKNKLV